MYYKDKMDNNFAPIICNFLKFLQVHDIIMLFFFLEDLIIDIFSSTVESLYFVGANFRG